MSDEHIKVLREMQRTLPPSYFTENYDALEAAMAALRRELDSDLRHGLQFIVQRRVVVLQQAANPTERFVVGRTFDYLSNLVGEKK